MSEDLPDRMPENMPNRMPEDLPDIMSDDHSKQKISCIKVRVLAVLCDMCRMCQAQVPPQAQPSNLACVFKSDRNYTEMMAQKAFLPRRGLLSWASGKVPVLKEARGIVHCVMETAHQGTMQRRQIS